MTDTRVVISRIMVLKAKKLSAIFTKKHIKKQKKKLLFAKSKVREKQNKPLSEMSFKEWLSKWLDTQKHIKASSYTTYSSLVNKHINTALGNIRLCDVTKLIIQDFVNGLASQWETSTVKLIYTELSSGWIWRQITV